MVLGVGLRKLCSLDSFGYAFREKNSVRNSTPGGCKTGPLGVQNGFREASGRLFNLAAKAARKPCLQPTSRATYCRTSGKRGTSSTTSLAGA